MQKPENFAPELSTIGSKPLAQIVFLPGMEHSLPSYIVAKIRQPRAFGASVKMPQFALTASQTDALATALLALTNRSRSMPDSLRVAAVPETNYQPAGHAGKLITELACFSCHRINGRGGEMAPDLTWEGSSVQRQWLTDFLHNPNTLRPSLIRRMPRFNLSDSDNKELTDYILAVYQSPSSIRISTRRLRTLSKWWSTAGSCSIRSMLASRATSPTPRRTRDTSDRH